MVDIKIKQLKDLKRKLSEIRTSSWSTDLAVDLGTANSVVYVKGRGIVLFEPSVVAFNLKTDEVLAVGREAQEMVGKTPEFIVAVRPLADGAISNFEATEQMFYYFFRRATGDKPFLFPRPRVIVSVSCGATEVEKKGIKDAAKLAGAKEVFLIQQPMADAIGAKLSIQEPGGNFVVDIGGGSTEIAVISLGGIVVYKSLKIAGYRLNQDIIRWAQEEFNLLIGERMAEEVKIKAGSVLPQKERLSIAMRGRNLATGLPEEVVVYASQVRSAILPSIKEIVREIKDTLERTPPELVSDIMRKGILLCGGTSQLRGLSQLIEKETKIPCKVADDPMTTVVRGAGYVLENLSLYRKVLLEEKALEPPK